MLSLKQIRKDYATGDGVVSALKGVDIEFREHEFVSILGPSGCGKTTLLNIIGGLDQYTDGDLIIGEKSTKNFRDADWDSYRNHRIGFVFQSYNLIPHQTVLSNVELALTLSGVSKTERRKRAKEALEQVGLGDQLNKKPNQMSGGQMQRVAIARALVNDPDILLADEPTGALDTHTSIQVMEILKSISKDKLIIMVTHNPDLATQYSSRIIKLLDGKVIDDSDPYDQNVVEPIAKVEVDSKKSAKQDKKEQKKLKTSMSFLTALSLSRNNLMTKKARTLLTSFAGSIGIIGIALILALSNGVQVYIDQVQGDTLSSYPLSITKSTTSIGDIMQTMAEQGNKEVSHPDDSKVYSQNQMSTMINTLMEETKVNDLKKFKTFLDSNKEIQDNTTDIQYSYSTTPYVYKEDTSDGVVQVNPSTVMDEMGFGEMMSTSTAMQESMGMSSSMMGGQGQDAFSEIIDNEDLISSQYDVLAGKMPESYDEVVLVVDKNNELNDYVLYTLGLLDKSDLKGVMQKIVSGGELSVDNEQVSYTYDELLSQKFRLIAPTDRYEKSGNSWVDMSEDESFMKTAVENGLQLKVVGILKPSEEASASSIGSAIGYRHDLMEYLLEKVNNSEIIKQQLDNPDTDVFTGLKFKTDEIEKTEDTSSTTDSTADSSTADSTAQIDMSQLTDEQKAQLQAAQQSGDNSSANSAQAGMQSGSMDMSQMMGSGMQQMTDAQKKYIASLTDEQLQLLQQMSLEQMEASQLAETNGEFANTTYDENMLTLGYATTENPSSINIYPKDFASKEKIIDAIDKYNDDAKDAGKDSDVIEYTDYVGLMMSSITTIINAISYILIAFVAISLVVSSIMIGIITYISVLERTKEIGILRAIGASKKDVSRVFNAETVIVGLVAGGLGIGISYLLTIPINLIIAQLTDVPMRASIPVVGAVILIAISVLLTLIAGLFPSKVAAKKDPVIALRTE